MPILTLILHKIVSRVWLAGVPFSVRLVLLKATFGIMELGQVIFFYSSDSFGVSKSGMGSIHGSKMFDHVTSFGDGCRLRKSCQSKSSKPPSGYEWAEYHPHFRQEGESNNVVYVASRHLEMDNVDTASLPGAGVFSYFSTSRRLTAPLAENKTTWHLPAWFYPTGNRMPLTYHRNARRWRRQGERTELKTVSRGQEFILDCDEYPEAVGWVYDLLQKK